MSKTLFEQHFGVSPQGLVSAPGRVNLIGEFTDYNDGWVLPCALEFRCHVAWRRREDNTVTVVSREYPKEVDEFQITDEYQASSRPWANYVRAVVAALRAEGYAGQGMDLALSSDVPQGRGLSSSAALEVSLLGAFNEAFGWAIEDTEIARLGQLSENAYIGCQCGIMDQLISAKAEPGAALLLDCQSLASTPITIPKQWSIVILDSNYPRKLVDSEYNARRADCEAACTAMAIPSLRAADLPQLAACRDTITAQQYQRAAHVLTENQRVIATATALQQADLTAVAEQLAEGHRSLANRYEVTVGATNTLVAIAKAELGDKVAARQTGGGFGGAVVCLCHNDDVAQLLEAVERDYTQKTGLEATTFVSEAGRGLEVNSYD